jgi:peroxiredoxin
MKKSFTFLFLSILFIFTLNAQTNLQDESNIKKAALDYAEGYYTGDPVRMELAIHPDFSKASPGNFPGSTRIIFNYSSYSGLIEACRSKSGLLDESKRKLEVFVLNLNDDIANVKVVSSQFNDYLQMVKVDDAWKIINVLWTGGIDVPARIKDFKPENEQNAVSKCAADYMDAVLSGDAKKIEYLIHPEYRRASFRKLPQTGKISFRLQGSGALVEAGIAKLGVADESKRNFQVKVIDIMSGLAVVEVVTPQNFEYLQLFKADDGWKVFHSLLKPNLNYSYISGLPPLLNQELPDFTLPAYGGDDFTLSKYRGKNVLLVFPRGWIGDHWCQLCHYQYAELLDYEKNLKIRKKYDLEKVYILPYNKEKVSDWVDKLPDALVTIESWKNPKGQNIPAGQQQFADFCKRVLSKKYEFKKGEAPTTIPILIDADRKVSKKYQLFTTFWDGVKSEQNTPSIFIIDKKGNLQFKYHSQTTFDRPGMEYLLDFIKKMK